ncbi:tetratricopeptide repeat protein [Tautonia sociabilis]|uniref:Tetratricopeptide repeat protein n=2 Tax=Tautonia sociabilis TaxID=2080755 RepID=A0A432MBX4_9BACT|nr:tetratricopeptide repeat protein [Tautonia sociabilis]
MGGWVAVAGASARADGLEDARRDWQTGRYARALERLEAIEPADPAEAARVALARAECLRSMGRIEEAVEALSAASEIEGEAGAEVLGLLAEIRFSQGEWDEAEALVARALERDDLCRRARWVVALLHEARGEAKEAVEAYRWFIRDYNARQRETRRDPDALCLIGRAAQRYYRATARGEELSQALNDVINELFEGAITVDPRCWQAAWLEGELFFEGYQEGSARRELNRALLINPSAAEVLVTLGRIDLENYALNDGREKAEAALEINPSYTPALVLLADLNISDERFDEALEAAKKAVGRNPKDPEALARLAASQQLLVNPLGAAAAEAAALKDNPRPAAFFEALGDRLADRRKYHPAERAFLKAIAADPEAAGPKVGLGMLYMQIGRETEARALFDQAFDADPFNIRADNMMKVLDHMASYEAIETEHYIVLVDPTQDRLLGRYMADYLEEIHPVLVDRFGYEPPGKTSIQIMKDHQMFSGRTTALPFIPTVGACTGKVVALASPTATRKAFNWARVLTHELAHVITLQQTNFNIPHWYTEALAVESEGGPRPQPWNTLLVERVPQRRLLNLETINLGFIRPREPDERQLAYCQAQLYARYMVKRFGDDALARLLEAYRLGMATKEAVESTFGVPVEQFEEGYLAYLDEVVETIRTRVEDEEPVSFSRLLLDLRKEPEDAALNAKVAYEYFARRDYKSARPFAEKALELEPHQPLASYVMARVMMLIGDEAKALELLTPALDEERPNERVVDLLAELTMKAGDLEEAARLYELARRDDPLNSKWLAGLARVHLRLGDEAAFLGDLAQLAENDSDDLAVRKVLAERHLARGEFEEAARWAKDCLHIDVNDPKAHVVLGDALMGLDRPGEAVREFEVALGLEPEDAEAIRRKREQALAASGAPEDSGADEPAPSEEEEGDDAPSPADPGGDVDQKSTWKRNQNRSLVFGNSSTGKVRTRSGWS